MEFQQAKVDRNSHPTNILNNFDVIQGGLLQLKKLGRLLERVEFSG